MLNYMVMAVTSQAVNPNLNNEVSFKVVVVVAKGNNHSITAATRGQQIDKNCTEISKGTEM